MAGKMDNYVLIIKLMTSSKELDLVKEFGYKVIVFATQLTISDALKADIPIEIDLNNDEIVLKKAKELAQKYNIVAVFTLNEYRVPLGALIRESLNLEYGIPYIAACRCRNKKETRKILTGQKINTVKYALVNDISDVINKVKEISLPVVIKPSNDAGSNGVFCCQTMQEVHQAVESIKKNTKNTVGQEMDEEFIVEEFLTGPEFSIETYTFKKKTEILAITSKKVLSPFFPIEIGHTVPANIENSIVCEIKNLIEDVIMALEIDNTVSHIEIKLTSSGPKIIEVNARPGGDDIPKLVEMVTGHNLHKIAFLATLGINREQISGIRERVPSASIRFLTSDKDGVMEFHNADQVLNGIDVEKMEIYMDKGEQVQKVTSNFNRLGYFIVRGNNNKHSDDIADDLQAELNFIIKEQEANYE